MEKENLIHTSVYTIFVKDILNDGYLLVHGYTGAIDYVNNRVAQWLKFGGQSNLRFDISDNTVSVLNNRGYLTELSPLQERAKVAKLAEKLHQRDKIIRSYLFMVAYDCNFRCPYCFENAISSNGKGWSKKVFTKEAVDRAYEVMLELEPDRRLHNNNITLYGGEPLLSSNAGIVEYIVNKGRERNYTFKAITNGYDIDRFLHLIKPGYIERLQITVDGKKDHHDQRRTHFTDGSTYDKIMANIGLALENGARINIRINTDLNNFDHLSELRDNFVARGYSENKNFSIMSALIHGDNEMNCNSIMATEIDDAKNIIESEKEIEPYSPDGQYIDFDVEQNKFADNEYLSDIVFHDKGDLSTDKIHTMNRNKYIDKYINKVKEDPSFEMISCQDMGIRQKIKNALEGKDLMTFRSVFCSAQTGMVIFDPCGDLYSCWETVGVDKHRIGEYKDKLAIYEEELNNWYGRNIGTVPACSKCKYAFFCGGGCQAHALTEGRGYKAPYCDGYAATFQKLVPEVYNEFNKSLVNGQD